GEASGASGQVPKSGTMPSDTPPPRILLPAEEGLLAPGIADGQLPSIPLSGELLYQILEAEMALQRQQYALGISRYLQLAVLTRDPRFAERSAQAALFIHDDQG